MTLNRTNIFLALLLAAVVAVVAGVRVDHSRPNFQITLGDDMTYSPAYGAYDVNDVFSDGRTTQTPVRGTIARGETPLHFEPTPQDALRAGDQIINPYDRKSEEGQAAIERGAAGFQIYCVSCHGSGGLGDGPVAKRGFAPPPSFLTGNSLKMKDGQLFHILTYGQSSMPPFAAQLSPSRRWDIINYIRDLQDRNPQADPPSPVRQKSESGP